MCLPYIGITDFRTFEQVQTMLSVFNAHISPGSERKLHVGVMTSYKTLHDIENGWSKAFPTKKEVAGILQSDKAYNCMHYVGDKKYSGYLDIAKAISLGGDKIHALQLDMVWPEPADITGGVHASRRQIEVILQIGEKAFKEAGNDPETVADKLESYCGVIDRVLLDKSMGRGIGLDADFLLPFARIIRWRFPHLGLVVAGGIGPDTTELVEPFLKEFPDVSIDAQGKLRPSGDAHDPIDWEMAKQYLIESLKRLE